MEAKCFQGQQIALFYRGAFTQAEVHAQVLCASSEAKDRVVPVAPPEGSAPGDRVTVAGFEQPPLEEVGQSVQADRLAQVDAACRCASNATGKVCIVVNVYGACLMAASKWAVHTVNPKKKILERLFPDMKTDAGEWLANQSMIPSGRCLFGHRQSRRANWGARLQGRPLHHQQRAAVISSARRICFIESSAA
eukprot:1160501-Pelagomonas_calceolata.AAC.5